MNWGRPRKTLHRTGLPGVMLAVLALVGQILIGAVVMPPDAAALGVVCSADAPLGSPWPPHHHHTPDCLVCPAAAATVAYAVILSDGPGIPAPAAHRIGGDGVPPPARAPPPAPRHTALPRGPPVRA